MLVVGGRNVAPIRPARPTVTAQQIAKSIWRAQRRGQANTESSRSDPALPSTSPGTRAEAGSLFGCELSCELERALRRSLGGWWLGCYAYLLFPVLTVGTWLRSYRCLRKTGSTPWDDGSTPWDDGCVTRVAGGPVPLWRATLAGVIAITVFTIVFGFEAIGQKEISREVQESILRSHGPSPTPAGTSNQFAPPRAPSASGFVDPDAPGYKPPQPREVLSIGV